MTREEFSQWVEQHYGELVATARRYTRRDPNDVVHQAVAGLLESGKFPETAPWTYMVNRIRGFASTARRSEARTVALETGVPASITGEKGEKRKGTPRMTKEQSALRYADTVYLTNLERDRRDFDMQGRREKDRRRNPDDPAWQPRQGRRSPR